MNKSQPSRTRRFIAWAIPCLMMIVLSAGCQSITKKTISPSQPEIAGFERDLSIARLSERHDEVPKAKKIYQAILQQDPNNQEALHRMGVIAAKEGHISEAFNYIESAMASGNASAELLGDRGYLQYKQGRYAAAEDTFNRSLDRDPRNERSINNLGLCLVAQQRYDQALTLFRKIGTEAEAYSNLAYAQSQRGDIAAAENNYHLALEADPDTRVAAEALLQIGKRVRNRNHRIIAATQRQLASNRESMRNRPRGPRIPSERYESPAFREQYVSRPTPSQPPPQRRSVRNPLIENNRGESLAANSRTARPLPASPSALEQLRARAESETNNKVQPLPVFAEDATRLKKPRPIRPEEAIVQVQANRNSVSPQRQNRSIDPFIDSVTSSDAGAVRIPGAGSANQVGSQVNYESESIPRPSRAGGRMSMDTYPSPETAANWNDPSNVEAMDPHNPESLFAMPPPAPVALAPGNPPHLAPSVQPLPPLTRQDTTYSRQIAPSQSDAHGANTHGAQPQGQLYGASHNSPLPPDEPRRTAGWWPDPEGVGIDIAPAVQSEADSASELAKSAILSVSD